MQSAMHSVMPSGSVFSAVRVLVPSLAVVSVFAAMPAAAQQPANIPILVPITGFLSLEGASQRNGALLAMRRRPRA